MIMAASLLVATLPAHAQTLADGVTARSAGNYAEAMRILLPLANKGDDEAQRMVGEMIFNGQGVPANPTAAFAWTEIAAKAGNRIAQYNLGYLYEKGIGAPQSLDQAIIWYKKSAGQNYVLSQRRLGELYETSDPSTSIDWYDKARLNGDEVALQRWSKRVAEVSAVYAEQREAKKRAEREEERAEYEHVQRMMDEARPSGNVIAQGIAEGLGKFQRDSAGISAIHQQTMANIQAQQAERRAFEREQAARQRAQDQRAETRSQSNQPAPRNPPVIAQQPTTQLAEASNVGTGGVAPAVGIAPSSAATASSAATKTAASSGTRLLPVQSWTFRHQFVSDNDTFPKDETEARRQVAAAKANREKQFGELVASYKRGGYGLDSWRVTLTEPVKCSNETGSYNRPFVKCTQRVDYAVVSTDAPSSSVLLYGYYAY